jgi:electron transport complex protein RnfD
VLLVLAGGLWLLCTKTIDWRAPVGMLAAAFIMSVIVGLDPLVMLLSGGLVFGAVFMTTDYVTSPVSEWGKFIFGAGCGIITVLIRRFGSYPEGVMYSILIMNMVVPFLNSLLHRRYGAIRKNGGSRKGVARNAPTGNSTGNSTQGGAK